MVIVILVTTPAVIDDVAVAVVPSPTDWTVLPIVTTGAELYPDPPLEIDIEDIVPNPVTIAVAAALTLESCVINLIFFWNVKSVSFSFWESNVGLKLSTYIAVDPTPTDFVIYALGLMTGS